MCLFCILKPGTDKTAHCHFDPCLISRSIISKLPLVRSYVNSRKLPLNYQGHSAAGGEEKQRSGWGFRDILNHKKFQESMREGKTGLVCLLFTPTTLWRYDNLSSDWNDAVPRESKSEQSPSYLRDALVLTFSHFPADGLNAGGALTFLWPSSGDGPVSNGKVRWRAVASLRNLSTF